VHDLLIGDIFGDLERPITHITRSYQQSTLNVSVTVQDRHILWPTHWCRPNYRHHPAKMKRLQHD